MDPLTDPTNIDQMMEACEILSDELTAMQSKIKDVKELKKESDTTGKGDGKKKPIAEQSSTMKKKTSNVKGKEAEKSRIPLSPRSRKPPDKKLMTSVEKRSSEVTEKVVGKTKPPAASASVKGKTDQKSPSKINPTVEKKSPTKQKEVAKVKPPVALSLAKSKKASVTDQKSPTNIKPGVGKTKSPTKESPEGKSNVPNPTQRKMAKVTAPISTKEVEKTKSARKQTTQAKGDGVPIPAKRKMVEGTDQTSTTNKPPVKKTSPYLVKEVEKKKLSPKQATQAKGDSAPIPAKRKMGEVHDRTSKANIKPPVKKTSSKEAEKKKLSPEQATQAKVEKTLPGVTETEAEKTKLHKVPSLTSLVKAKMRERITPKCSTTNIKPPKKTETEAEKPQPQLKETTTEAKRDNVPIPTSPVKEKMVTKIPHQSSNVNIKSSKKATETEAEKPKPSEKVPSLTSLVKQKMREKISPPTSTTNIKPPRKTTETEAKITKPHKVPSVTSLVKEKMRERISPPTSTPNIKTPKKATDANRDNLTKKPLKEVCGSGTSSANKGDERVNADSDSDGYSTETGKPITNETYSEDGSAFDEASSSSLDVKKKQYKVRSLASLVKEKMRERISPKSSRTNLKPSKKATDDSDAKSDNDNATETVMPIIDESYSEEDSAGDDGSMQNKGEQIDDEASSCSIDTNILEDENEEEAAGSGGSSNLTERSYTDDELADLPVEDEDGPVSTYVNEQHMGFQTEEFNAPCLSTILEVDENEISSDTGKGSDANRETAQDIQVPEVSGSSSEIQVADSTTQRDTQVVESQSTTEFQNDEQATEETQPEESTEATEETQPEESAEATEETQPEESAELSGSSSLIGGDEYEPDELEAELSGSSSAIGGGDNDALEAELSGSSSAVGGDEDDEYVAELSDSSSAIAGNEDDELSGPSSENLGDEEADGEEVVLSDDECLQCIPLNQTWATDPDFWEDDEDDHRSPEMSDNSTQTITPYQEETVPEVDSAGDEASSGSVDNTLLQLENLDEGPSRISCIAEPTTETPKPQRLGAKTHKEVARHTDAIECHQIPKPKVRSSGAPRMSSIGNNIPIDSSDEEQGILSDRKDEESVKFQQFAERQEVIDGHDIQEVHGTVEQPQSTVVDEQPAEGRPETHRSNPSWLHMDAKTIDLGYVDAATQKQSRDTAKYVAEYTESATTSESNLFAMPDVSQVRDNAPQSQSVHFQERYPYDYEDDTDREWGSQPERTTRGRGRSRMGDRGRGVRGGRGRSTTKERLASQCIHECCPICNPQSPLESRSPSPERFDQPDDRNSRSKSLARRRKPQGNFASRSKSDGKSITYNRNPPQCISTSRNPPQSVNANKALPQSRNQPSQSTSRANQYGYRPNRGNQANSANRQPVPTRSETSPPGYQRPLVYSSQSNARTALLLNRDNRSPVRANRDPVCSVRSVRQPSDFCTREVANIPISNDPMPEPKSNPSNLLIPITKLTSNPPPAETSGDGTLPDTAISSRYRSPFPEKCDINEEGNIHLIFRGGIEVYLTVDLGILMTCPSKRITIAVSANNSHLGIMHPYGRLYQQDGEVQVQCPYRESIQRFATITEDNRVFLTNTHSTVVVESTVKGPYVVTSGRIFNVSDDIPQRILTSEGRSGREYQADSAALWKDAAIEHLVSNDLLTLKHIRINQMPNGSVSIYKESPHMRIQISPLTGACRVNTARYRVKADSRSHLINFFLEQGTNRVVSQKGNFIIRNAEKSCGFDGWNRFKVDFRFLRNEPKMGEAYFEN